MRKFHRTSGRRRLFLQALATNLIMKGKIKTTVARAKEIRPVVERMVTTGKHGRVADLRLLLKKLPKNAAERLFHEVAPRYKERRGGYLRIVKSGRVRKRDGVPQALIEFV